MTKIMQRLLHCKCTHGDDTTALRDANDVTVAQDIEQEKVAEVTYSLDEIDGLMYNAEIERGNTNFGSKSMNYKKLAKYENELEPTFRIANWSGKGDILTSLTAFTEVWGKDYNHGHAAILSTSADYVIETLPRPGVVHQSATVYWDTVSDEVQYYVKGAPDSAYTNAVSYALKQVGDPYKIVTKMNDETEWYCSKLVYKAWKAVGYDIGSIGGIGGAVTPAHLANDYDTIAYKWDIY